jgi:CheY-like chemotaxis protein
LRVLIVEDHADTAASMAILLELFGHEVQTVGDGVTAVERAAAWSPDVVLLDIVLPGLDGYDVARRLRRQEQGRRAFLVAITGLGQPSDRRRSHEAGIDVHLVKPVDPELLRRLLESQGGPAMPAAEQRTGRGRHRPTVSSPALYLWSAQPLLMRCSTVLQSLAGDPLLESKAAALSGRLVALQRCLGNFRFAGRAAGGGSRRWSCS